MHGVIYYGEANLHHYLKLHYCVREVSNRSYLVNKLRQRSVYVIVEEIFDCLCIIEPD